MQDEQITPLQHNMRRLVELDDLQNTIRMLLDSIEQMEIADEQAAGDVDD
ncbi:hypothetical protein [Pseudomonas syringae group genomosp. 3]|uniref:Uncharacterized protein n=1 Tax=Pseudomonas syringae pv. persicae TaxID=237306 RepID=A0A3M4A825_9PSED|nr:hypothetical protein [Pseudomonas syringae group genomosp. 3]RMP02426.1 hypothetical protein ALQ30_200099 [Pseudomonas syringae pv. persicae]